ncbi:MAG: (Fe-S)-binding protein [Phycisphaerae bacterium]|nr:(Fe-S)-binding protein [Phycisphaerae bacterium]
MTAVHDLDARLRTCIHCGLCLEHCPTYVDLCTEMDSPRGRIVLMRGLHERRIEPTPAVAQHLNRCLGCRGCETACPSGVRYGELLEHFRSQSGLPAESTVMPRLMAFANFYLFPYRRRMRAAVAMARAVRWLGASHLVRATPLARWIPDWMLRLDAMLPTTIDAAEPLRREYRAGPRDAQRARLFIGCVAEVLRPRTHRATIRVLNRHGCDVECPPAQGCCGALHLHAGRRGEACALARANIDALHGDAPVITNVAGCGAMLKQYGDLLADDPAYAAPAAEFARRVRDVSEFVATLEPVPPTRAMPIRAVYHDPCHLGHAQSVRSAPRELLRRIPGLQLVELNDGELCCGAAGIYNLTHPDIADRLAEAKLRRIRDTRAELVITGNIGCMLHLGARARRDNAPIRIVHTMELLDEACDPRTAPPPYNPDSEAP